MYSDDRLSQLHHEAALNVVCGGKFRGWWVMFPPVPTTRKSDTYAQHRVQRRPCKTYLLHSSKERPSRIFVVSLVFYIIVYPSDRIEQLQQAAASQLSVISQHGHEFRSLFISGFSAAKFLQCCEGSTPTPCCLYLIAVLSWSRNSSSEK